MTEITPPPRGSRSNLPKEITKQNEKDIVLPQKEEKRTVFNHAEYNVLNIIVGPKTPKTAIGQDGKSVSYFESSLAYKIDGMEQPMNIQINLDGITGSVIAMDETKKGKTWKRYIIVVKEIKGLQEIDPTHWNAQLFALFDKLQKDFGKIFVDLKVVQKPDSDRISPLASIQKINKEIVPDGPRSIYINLTAWGLNASILRSPPNEFGKSEIIKSENLVGCEISFLPVFRFDHLFMGSTNSIKWNLASAIIYKIQSKANLNLQNGTLVEIQKSKPDAAQQVKNELSKIISEKAEVEEVKKDLNSNARFTPDDPVVNRGNLLDLARKTSSKTVE